MIVEFSDFFVIPRFFYRLLGFLPFIDGKPFNLEQTLFFMLGMLNLNLTIVLEIMYLINAINSSTFLEVTALTPCIGFCILGVFKLYIVWTHRHQLTSLLADFKELFPNDDQGQQRFQVVEFLQRTNGVEYPYLYVLFFGMGAFNCFPLCSSIYEHFYQGS